MNNNNNNNNMINNNNNNSNNTNNNNNVLYCSPLLKRTCVREVVLDKWLPLIKAGTTHR